MSQNGKGSAPRPKSIDNKTWSKNYNRIFNHGKRNLKENKTLFILCDCQSEVLLIEYDHEMMMADLAIYENYSSFNHKMSLWQRIRYCWRVLWHRKPYTDQLMLSAKQIQDLRLFLNQIDL